MFSQTTTNTLNDSTYSMNAAKTSNSSYYTASTSNSSYYIARASNTSHSTAISGFSAPSHDAPKPLSPYVTALRKRRLILSPAEELNWSGRGQHVEFGKSEKLPLEVKPPAIGQGSTA